MLLLLLAITAFVLEQFDVTIGSVELVPAGLALFAAHFLWDYTPRSRR